ncbi:MAG: hypothetical protein QOD92_2199 [Acidimicrobiaceae bacterium]
MSVVQPLPALIHSRRRLASELLSAAARHSAVVDEIHDLEQLREARPWTDDETQRYAELRELRGEARRRHDLAARDLKRLMAGARIF